MKKRSLIWALALCFLLLSGCSGAMSDRNTISVDKKGRITCTVVEDFGKSFYDEEELRGVIEEDVKEYNKNFGTDHMTLKKFEVKDGVAFLQTRFDEAKYYADYAGLTLFVGTVAEAMEEGYDLSGECMDADGSLTDVGSLADSGEAKVVILEEAVQVQVPGEIICVSRAGNVQITDKKLADVQEARQAFVVYK